MKTNRTHQILLRSILRLAFFSATSRDALSGSNGRLSLTVDTAWIRGGQLSKEGQHITVDTLSGLWAVVNTNGVCCRGRLESQDGSAWDTMLRVNLVGTLKASRTFLPLLRSKKGRLINLGASEASSALGTGRRSVGRSASMLAGAATAKQKKEMSASGGGQHSNGLVAYTSARFAVEGASAALRMEVAPLGIDVHVISMESEDSSGPAGGDAGADVVNNLAERLQMRRLLEKHVAVLPLRALRAFDEALLSKSPKESYELLCACPRPPSKPKSGSDGTYRLHWVEKLMLWSTPVQETVKETNTKQLNVAA
ncbi:hypothetical protein J437_LFUL010166 [Ladona fulva]|uniref:Uncharacterized protein n=1 Tax=Ladona fulva TaxID=123851 RepID=A0A8K0KB90_LADFU|nr:hypothetical protein J437_LFUL010166 [Ladona fulva]